VSQHIGESSVSKQEQFAKQKKFSIKKLTVKIVKDSWQFSLSAFHQN